jgi:hypothetical protein
MRISALNLPSELKHRLKPRNRAKIMAIPHGSLSRNQLAVVLEDVSTVFGNLIQERGVPRLRRRRANINSLDFTNNW